MIHPFGLDDLWLVRRLQRSSMPLAIEQALTHPHPPLWTALTAPWPWAGAGVATFVLKTGSREDQLSGFAQLMKRPARPEADLTYLAPALPQQPDRPASASPGIGEEVIWQRLLNHCTAAAATHGLQRVFASTPDGCPEQACLRQAGFSLYARETIYRLAATPGLRRTIPPGGTPAGFRPQQPQDSWALQRLYTRSTPRLVQQAEGALSGEVGSPSLSWWEPDRWLGIVWEPAGEVRGAVQVHIGRAGHWLRTWGASRLGAADETSARDLRLLIEQGLRQIDLAAHPRREHRVMPVYATVRDYEVGLSGALTGFGFAPYMERTRYVKHTVSAVRESSAVMLADSPPARGQEVPVRVEAWRW